MSLQPKGYEIRALRRRHKLTQGDLAESLYDVKEGTIRDWENGRRKCASMNWWAIVLTWDKIDLWSDEDEWIRRFREKPMD